MLSIGCKNSIYVCLSNIDNYSLLSFDVSVEIHHTMSQWLNMVRNFSSRPHFLSKNQKKKFAQSSSRETLPFFKFICSIPCTGYCTTDTHVRFPVFCPIHRKFNLERSLYIYIYQEYYCITFCTSYSAMKIIILLLCNLALGQYKSMFRQSLTLIH